MTQLKDRLPRETVGELDAWNARWDGRCQNCGKEFTADLTIESGHRAFSKPDEDFTRIAIGGGESTFGACDYWDVQPVIDIRVTRAHAGNAGNPWKTAGNLTTESTIVLTKEECDAIFGQLYGELSVLLSRKAWSRDTT